MEMEVKGRFCLITKLQSTSITI